MGNILLYNATIVPMTAQTDSESKWFIGSVGIVGKHIAFVSPDKSDVDEFMAAYPDARYIDCSGKLVMPGLINTHCHVAMTLQRSSADDIALMEWLNDYIWPFEARQSAEDIALGARLGVVEMLLGGVTSFVDMYWHEEAVFDAVESLGMRALLAESCLDANIDESVHNLELLLEKVKTSDRIKAAMGPHAAYSCSPETLLRAKAVCDKHNLPMTIHLAETLDEKRIVKERYGCSPVEHFDRLGMLHERQIAAHCVHLSDSDIEILQSRGVHVAHNPSSNMKISSGVAPIDRLSRSGVNCSIATDGPCSNNDLDMWEEMRAASFLQKVSTMNPLAVPAYDILKMTTVNAAAALGYEGSLGIIRKGALADVIVIDLMKPHIYPLHDIIANLVYCVKASDVETVIVNGDVVVENRKIEGVDMVALCQEVHQRAMELSKKC